MAVSLILTEQIIKLFIILLLGFLLVKFGLLKASDSKSVSGINSCLSDTSLYDH